MHETTTTSVRPVDRATMAAIATVPATVRGYALDHISLYRAKAETAAHGPDQVYRELTAFWACIAREEGATEHQIADAEQEGHHTDPDH